MQEEIQKAIARMLASMDMDGVDFVVEHPTDSAHGDYASNVALVCAKRMGKNPREIAEQFRALLEGVIPQVARIEIAGAGFINFFLVRDFFSEKIAHIRSHPDTWGYHDTLKGEEILFEYTSPNLFKPLHIGNLVGNIIGESLSRLFEMAGATVRRINYPSDIGLTVAKGVWGLQKTSGDVRDISKIGEAYRVGNEAYENDATAKQEIEAVNRALYAGTDEVLQTLRARGIETSRARFAELCAILDTSFDFELFESEVSDIGKRVVMEHMDHVFVASDGAVIFEGERYGLHTRVFLNAQGLPTYEAKDLGNFVVKTDKYPNWTQYFVVTGGEQREYFKVLICALRQVFPETRGKVVEHVPTGFLTLTTGKMSSRKGNVLTGESIIAEVMEEARVKASESRSDDVEILVEMVAIAAIKYQILRQAIGSDIVFDKARALSLEGDSGPYLQYTHARILSTEAKARALGIIPSHINAPETPYDVERLLYQFEEVVERARRERAPHHVLTYLTELTGAFNTFYAHERIADKDDAYAPYKVALAEAIRITLKNGLWALGIRAPDAM